MEAFAGANGKTARQVGEAYSFLVNRRILEFSDEGLGGKGGRGKGKGVARRFEREMGEDRLVIVFFLMFFFGFDSDFRFLGGGAGVF